MDLLESGFETVVAIGNVLKLLKILATKHRQMGELNEWIVLLLIKPF